METINQVVKYLNENATGLGFLYTLLGGLIAASLFIGKPLLTYLLALDSKKEEGKQTVVNVNALDINAIRELLAASKAEVAPPTVPQPASVTGENPKQSTTEEDVLKAAAVLSKFRDLLKPSKLLTPDVFPSGMRVLKFDPERLLVISLQVTPGVKGGLAAFCIIHWTLFPGLAGAWLASIPFHATGSLVGGLIGAAVGLFFWARLTRDGPYIRINLQKRTYALISVAYATWYTTCPTADSQSAYQDNRWVATARIANQPVAISTSTRSQANAEGALTPFVTAFNWSLGNRIPIADGVYIEAPKPLAGGVRSGS
jgi:hypothetical protein